MIKKFLILICSFFLKIFYAKYLRRLFKNAIKETKIFVQKLFNSLLFRSAFQWPRLLNSRKTFGLWVNFISILAENKIKLHLCSYLETANLNPAFSDRVVPLIQLPSSFHVAWWTCLSSFYCHCQWSQWSCSFM